MKLSCCYLIHPAMLSQEMHVLLHMCRAACAKFPFSCWSQQAVRDKIKGAAQGVACLIKSQANNAADSAQKVQRELSELQSRYLAKAKAADEAQSVE